MGGVRVDLIHHLRLWRKWSPFPFWGRLCTARIFGADCVPGGAESRQAASAAPTLQEKFYESETDYEKIESIRLPIVFHRFDRRDLLIRLDAGGQHCDVHTGHCKIRLLTTDFRGNFGRMARISIFLRRNRSMRFVESDLS